MAGNNKYYEGGLGGGYNMKNLKMGLDWAKKIFNIIKAGVVIIDPDDRSIVDINDQALIMIGRSKEDLVGKPCSIFCSQASTVCPILDQGLDLEDYETTIERADGTYLIILKTVNTILSDNKRYLVESFIDITELQDDNYRIQSLLELSKEYYKSEVGIINEVVNKLSNFTKEVEILCDKLPTKEFTRSSINILDQKLNKKLDKVSTDFDKEMKILSDQLLDRETTNNSLSTLDQKLDKTLTTIKTTFIITIVVIGLFFIGTRLFDWYTESNKTTNEQIIEQ